MDHSLYNSFSPRQQTVLHGILEGLTYKEIAHQMHLSPKTIDTWRSRIFKKCGVRHVATLTRFAIREGWIQP